MDSKKKTWILTDCWELGYDFSCPSCGYTFFMRQKFGKKPEECPKCKEQMYGEVFVVSGQEDPQVYDLQSHGSLLRTRRNGN